jgi:uncharacterized membrane protein
MHEAATVGERIADRAAALIGSWRFILVQTIFVMVWVGLNVGAWSAKWDPARETARWRSATTRN